jgi:hypothetical protein
MQFTQLGPAPVPVRRELSQAASANPLMPGFVIGLGPVLRQNPLLRQSIGTTVPHGTECSPVLLVEPEQTPWIFAHESELALVKCLAGLALQNIQYAQTTVDALWLVYGAAKLHHDWNLPNRDTGACVFKMFGLGLGVANLAGGISPGLAIPDHWKNGVNFVFKSGEALYEGKTPPISEMMVLSADKRMEVPIKLMKYFGLALDPNPLYRSITTAPISGLHVQRPT